MSVVEYLKTFVLEMTDVEESDFSADMSIEQAGLDSLDFIELKVGLNKRYGVKIEPEALTSGRIKTIADFVDYVQNLMQPASGELQPTAPAMSVERNAAAS